MGPTQGVRAGGVASLFSALAAAAAASAKVLVLFVCCTGLLAVDGFCPGSWPRRGRRLPRLCPAQACAMRDGKAPSTSQVLPRADFTAVLLITGAAGVLAHPAPGDAADKPAATRRRSAPRFIDVSVDIGEDLVLNVRQPFGLRNEKSGEGGGDKQGTYVWPASADMARFLTSKSGRKIVQGRRVLELGAGTAVSGLAAALVGAERVCFTDGSLGVFAVRCLLTNPVLYA
jgi:hypothetical protein